MSIAVTCKTCGSTLKAPDRAAGRALKCPKCNSLLDIPGAVTATPKAPAAIPLPIQPPVATAWVGDPSVNCPGCGRAISYQQHELPLIVECSQCKTEFNLDVPNGPSPTTPQSPIRAVATQRCPYCAETINASAKKCKHCGEMIDVALRAVQDMTRASQAPQAQPMVFMNAGGGASSSSSSSAAAASSGDDYVARPRYTPPFPHGWYIFLTLFTGGIGLSIWFLHCLVDSRPSAGAKTIVGMLFCFYWGATFLVIVFFCLVGTAAINAPLPATTPPSKTTPNTTNR